MKTIVTLLFFLSFFCLVMISCKKETADSKNKSTLKVYDENYLKTVKAFIIQMEDISNGKILKSSEYLKIEDAADRIEAAINFKYCFPDEKISGSKILDSIIDIVPDSLDYLKMTSIESIYASIKDIIIYHLTHSDYNKYKLVAMLLEPDLNRNQVKLYTVIGNTYLTSYPESDYWYGDMLGTCDNQFVFETDAAEFIQNRLHEYFLSLRPTPSPGCRYTYIGSKMISVPRTLLDPTPDNYLDYDIFKASTEFNNPPSQTLDDVVKCFGYTDEILFYEPNYKQLIEDEQVGLWVYNGCDVRGYPEYEIKNNISYYTINHSLEVILSIRLQECGVSNPINITD